MEWGSLQDQKGVQLSSSSLCYSLARTQLPRGCSLFLVKSERPPLIHLGLYSCSVPSVALSHSGRAKLRSRSLYTLMHTCPSLAKIWSLTFRQAECSKSSTTPPSRSEWSPSVSVLPSVCKATSAQPGLLIPLASPFQLPLSARLALASSHPPRRIAPVCAGTFLPPGVISLYLSSVSFCFTAGRHNSLSVNKN